MSQSHHASLRALVMGASTLIMAAAIAAPALAADSGKDKSDSTLSEVVVTAEYRQQNLQKTPLSITAVTADQLEQRSAVSILDVAQAAPNVTLREASTGSGRSTQAFIRGIGQGDFLLTYSPRIGMYIDDVYHSTVFGSIFDLVDVDRVEVLRGPQGTLFGRAAAGGAIRIFSKEPKGDGSGYVEASMGSDNFKSIKGTMDVPLVQDVLAARVTVSYHKQDGYVHLDNFACAFPSLAGRLPSIAGTNNTHAKDPCQIGTLGGTDIFSSRLQLKWTPNDKITSNFSADYTDDRSESSPDTLTAAPWYTTRNPTTGNAGGAPESLNGLGAWYQSIGVPDYNLPAATGNFGGLVGVPNMPTAAMQAALYPNNPFVSYAISQNPGLSRPPNTATGDPGSQFLDPPVSTVKSWGIANTTDLDLIPEVRIKAITAYRAYSGQFGASQASLPLPVQESTQGVVHHQFSEELQISGDLFDKRLEWTTGAFYLNTFERNYGRVQFEGFAIGGNSFIQDFRIDDPATLKNRSAFVHGVYHFTDQLSLEAGIRYSWEKKTYSFLRDYYYFLGLPTGLFSFGQPTSGTTNRWNPRVALNYEVTPDIMLYTSYSTGFTAGGINGRPFSPGGAFPFQPEDLKSYEAGFKSEWLDRRLRLNADVFLTKYNNMQVTLFGSPGHHADQIFYVDNGGSSELKGFEAELEARPTHEWTVTAATGYTHFAYTSLLPTTNPSNDPFGLNLDSPLFGQPAWKVSLSTLYNLDLGGAGVLTPFISGTWQSAEYFDTIKTNPYTTQKGFWVFNARVTWRPTDPDWSLSLGVTNLFDKLYYNSKFDGRTGFGYASGQVAAPREFTVSVRRNF